MSFSGFMVFIMIALGVSIYLSHGSLIIGTLFFLFIMGMGFLLLGGNHSPIGSRSIPQTRKERILKLQQGKCARCGDSRTHLLQFHHIKQYANGGSNGIDNLEALCPTCHYEETQRQRHEYM